MKSFFLTPFSILCFMWPLKANAFIYLDYAYNHGARPVNLPILWDGTGLGKPLNANTANAKVTFYINPDLQTLGGTYTPTLTSEQFVHAAQIALLAWHQALCTTTLQVVYGGPTTENSLSLTSKNIILYDNNELAASYCPPSSAGCAAVYYDGASMELCQIVLVGAVDFLFSTVGAEDMMDVATVLAHEIGHCLGLDHTVDLSADPPYSSTNPFLTDAIMTAYATYGRVQHSLTQDERDAVTCMYPTPTGNDERNTCLSYHGTNGGAAISGVQTGGPQQDYGLPNCGDSAGRPGIVTVGASGASGSGCVSKAVAASNTGEPTTWQDSLVGLVSWLCSLCFAIPVWWTLRAAIIKQSR